LWKIFHCIRPQFMGTQNSHLHLASMSLKLSFRTFLTQNLKLYIFYKLWFGWCCIICMVFYACYSFHGIHCIVFYIYCVLCIVLCALYYMHSILCSDFYVLYTMHIILFEHLCFHWNSLHTNQPTYQPTDIVTYWAAIVAKKIWTHIFFRINILIFDNITFTKLCFCNFLDVKTLS
jgi:hypothetical protein